MKLGSNMAGRTGIWMSVICLLSVVLVAVSVYSMYGIKERTTIIYKHSYVVSNTAKEKICSPVSQGYRITQRSC